MQANGPEALVFKVLGPLRLVLLEGRLEEC